MLSRRGKVFFFFSPPSPSLSLFFRSQVGSFLHSTTSGRWEDVIASALLPPPVGGGENPIWSKSVKSGDGARTGRPAPPLRRTSPGRRPLPGTVIGPASPGATPDRAPTRGQPSSPPLSIPRRSTARLFFSSPSPPSPAQTSPHPPAHEPPKPPPASPLGAAALPSPAARLAPFSPNHPALRSPCFPFCLLRRPLHL